MKERVLVAMSGGVDSSAAAWVLRVQGYECVGAIMRLHEKEGSTDVEDARSVAERLGIPFHVFDFREEFGALVKQYFADTYAAGDTPNPCVQCNRHLKFGKLLEAARDLGCSKIATGHYARIAHLDNGRFAVKKGAEAARDQSYFLSLLTQDQLGATLFPLSDLPKAEVRRIAEEQGFVSARKRDSQDICFAPDGDYVGFLEQYNEREYVPGPVYHLDGRHLGEHRGAIRYTLGQRKGLGVSAGEPVYVCGKSMAENTVYVGPESALFADTLIAEDFVWGAIPGIDGPLRCKARVRYRHAEQSALAEPLGDGRVKVTFDAPQRAITTGQVLVLYDGDTVLGGGTIREVK